MYFPTIEQVKEITSKGQYDIVPITKEIYSDATSPIEVMRILKSVSSHCYMLESIEDSQKWGRYTFLGFQPKSEITCVHGVLKVNGVAQRVNHPKEYIRQVLKKHRSPKIEGMPTFTGGLVGYFAYDYFSYSEPTLQLDAKDNEGFNDVDLMLFDKVICFDNFKQKIILIVNISSTNVDSAYVQGVQDLESLSKLILTGTKASVERLELQSEFMPLFSKDTYCQMVDKAKAYIKEGDIFQVVLSNRHEAKVKGSLFDMYRVLRTTNPSPYMFYFSSNDIEIAGASPETLVKLTDDTLYTFPLAGTRPRGKNMEEDKRLEIELLQDQKELAEHNMLVDLGRNDIGRISQFGSVAVEKYQNIEKFSHVMHIGSTVKGKIVRGKDALDAIEAILPAGTLSGAPKIRAMQIIDELENNKRGIYGGTIGYLDFTGNLDTCIAIRVAYKKKDKVFVRSGAGIVYDSVSTTEYKECLHKAQAVIDALQKADGGILK